jgi:hypothetical protein
MIDYRWRRGHGGGIEGSSQGRQCRYVSHFTLAMAAVRHLSSSSRCLSRTSSVSEAEIAHFSRLSSRWWDESGEFGLLHRMNPARVRFLRSREPVLKGKRVLDVGCGGGLFSEVRNARLESASGL